MVEIRGLAAADVVPWEMKAKGYEEKIGKLAQDIEWAETTNQGKDESKKKTVDEMTTVEITKQALKVQDKTQESTQRAKKALEETIQIGISVNQEVKKQGEKIKEIEEGLEQVETNLKRADKQVRIFIRRLSSDKIFLMMITLMVIGIIGAIAVSLLKRTCPSVVKGYLC